MDERMRVLQALPGLLRAVGLQPHVPELPTGKRRKYPPTYDDPIRQHRSRSADQPSTILEHLQRSLVDVVDRGRRDRATRLHLTEGQRQKDIGAEKIAEAILVPLGTLLGHNSDAGTVNLHWTAIHA